MDQVRAQGIKQVLSAPRSPWQRAYVERLIGSIRRECLDHMIVFGERCTSTFLVMQIITIGGAPIWRWARTPQSHEGRKDQPRDASSSCEIWAACTIVMNAARREYPAKSDICGVRRGREPIDGRRASMISSTIARVAVVR